MNKQTKIAIFLIFLVSITLLFTVESDNKKIDINYKIGKSSCFEPYKCSYDIILEDVATKEDLKSIAYKIKQNSPIVKRVFIGYYLSCSSEKYRKIFGYWATSHFNPDLSVSIRKSWNVGKYKNCAEFKEFGIENLFFKALKEWEEEVDENYKKGLNN